MASARSVLSRIRGAGPAVLVLALALCADLAAGADGQVCRRLAAGRDPGALAACRDALEAAPDDVDLVALVAELEYRDGDAERAVALWRAVMASDGWSTDRATGLARALARSGDRAAAEAVLREIVRRDPSSESRADLAHFLLGSGQAAEAAEVAAAAALEAPESCDLEELWGEALAAAGDDEGAARRFRDAVDLGCPPYRWTRLGPVPQRLGAPAYRDLLIADEMVAGLDRLDDAEVRRRFELLAPVMTADAAPAVTDQVLERSDPQLRLAGLGLLAACGCSAAESWSRVLDADDLVLRKQALRRLREVGQPCLAPQLEAHLERESLPGNRNLTALVLGELLAGSGDLSRARRLLAAIPPGDVSYPPARLALSELSEREGRFGEALQYLEEARAAAPGFGVDPEREARLRELAGSTAGSTVPTAVPDDEGGPPSQIE